MSDDRPETFDALGTPIAAVKPDDVLGFVDRTIADDGHEYVCVCRVNNVMSAPRRPRHRARGAPTPKQDR